MSSGLRHRRWSVPRGFRHNSASQTDDDEESTSSTQRNNAVDPSVHSTAPNSPNQEQTLSGPSAVKQVTQMELQLLKRMRRVERVTMKLWRSVFMWQIVKFMAFVCLCGCIGLCCRFCFSRPSVQLRQFMHDLDLDMYVNGLMNVGYDRLEDILWATDKDLLDAGVALRPHRLRILYKAHSLQQTEFPWILWSLVAVFVLWVVASGVFVTVFAFNREFRMKCVTVGLWTLITIWGRAQIYRRVWKEFKETEERPVGQEIVLHQ